MSETVPEFWTDPTARAPLRARPVGWWLALPALIALPFAPKRVGARVGQSRWAPTLAAHLSCLILTLLLGAHAGWLAYADTFGAAPSVPARWPEVLREGVCGTVNMLYVVTDRTGDIYLILGGLTAVHAGAWLIGLFLMPFAAAGERLRRLYLRSVKLVLWSTTCLVPLGLAVLAVASIGVRYDEGFDDVEWETAVVGVAALWLVWWLSVLLRLGARYAGPSDGPGWQPRRPQCTACGYVLTGLHVNGRCPECGLVVQASLPEARKPALWAAAMHSWARPGVYVRTVWNVLRDGRFFRSLVVYRNVSAAVSFAAWTILLMGTLCPLATVIAADPYEASPLAELAHAALRFAIATAVVVTLLAIGLGLVALRACKLGSRDPRPSTVAVCYGVALFWPMIAALWGSAVGLLLAVDAGWIRGGLAVPVLGWVEYGMLWGLGLALPVVAMFTWGLVRLRRALRDVRFTAA